MLIIYGQTILCELFLLKSNLQCVGVLGVGGVGGVNNIWPDSSPPSMQCTTLPPVSWTR